MRLKDLKEHPKAVYFGPEPTFEIFFEANQYNIHNL